MDGKTEYTTYLSVYLSIHLSIHPSIHLMCNNCTTLAHNKTDVVLHYPCHPCEFCDNPKARSRFSSSANSLTNWLRTKQAVLLNLSVERISCESKSKLYLQVYKLRSSSTGSYFHLCPCGNKNLYFLATCG